jgi:hypothetical protein
MANKPIALFAVSIGYQQPRVIPQPCINPETFTLEVLATRATRAESCAGSVRIRPAEKAVMSILPQLAAACATRPQKAPIFGGVYFFMYRNDKAQGFAVTLKL